MTSQPNETIHNYAVIGAGVSGLVRALALVDQGETPIIIDPNPSGGLINSIQCDGFTLECGATTLVDTPEIRTLLCRFNLEGEMLFPAIPNYRQYLWYSGLAHAVPRGPLQILTSPLLPGFEKVKLVRGLFRKLHPAEFDECGTIDALFTKLLSTHIASQMIAPVLRGIFGGDTKKLVASAVFPKLWNFLRGGGTLARYIKERQAIGKRTIFQLRGGNSVLVDALVTALREKAQFINAAATSLILDQDCQLFRISLSSGEFLVAKNVSIATPGATTASFIGPVNSDLAVLLRELRYAPIAVVHLSVDSAEKFPAKGFGVLFQENDRGLLGILFNSNLFPSSAPPGRALLTVCLGGVGRIELIKESEESLSRNAQELVRRYLGISETTVLNCTRWERAIPQYEDNIIEIHRRMSELEKQLSGLSFIGSERGGVGVPSRVEKALNLPT